MTTPQTRRQPSVVCLGVHILDVLGRPVPSVPPGQGSLLLDEIRLTAAGTAAGTSVDLARLGVPVASIGAIGTDAAGELLVSLLEREGVDTSLLVRREGARTSATMLPIRPNGERPALHAPGADSSLTAEDLSREHRTAVQAARFLHLGGVDALGPFAGEPLLELVTKAKQDDTVVTLDVLRPGDQTAFERLAPLLEHVDWFLPNEDQLRRLTGEDRLEHAAKAVRALGAKALAVTCGEAGCLLSFDDELVVLPALSVDVVDTTGCGDGFDAGFITGLLLGGGPVEAAWLGTACGALVATGLGSDAGISSLEETLALLETASHAATAVASLAATATTRPSVGAREAALTLRAGATRPPTALQL